VGCGCCGRERGFWEGRGGRKSQATKGLQARNSGADFQVGLEVQRKKRNNARDANALSRTSAVSEPSPHYIADLSLSRPPPPPAPQSRAYLVSFDSPLCFQSRNADFVALKCFGPPAACQMQSSLRSANLQYHQSALTTPAAQHIPVHTPSPYQHFIALDLASTIL